MDPKQHRALEQGEHVDEMDEPRDLSWEERPRPGKDGEGHASGRTGEGVVTEESTNAPPTGRGNLGRRPPGNVTPKRPGKEDHG